MIGAVAELGLKLSVFFTDTRIAYDFRK